MIRAPCDTHKVQSSYSSMLNTLIDIVSSGAVTTSLSACDLNMDNTVVSEAYTPPNGYDR